MAELHVQKKEGNVWPWIVAAVIVLALLFWFLWGRGDDLNVAAVNDTDSTMVGAMPNDGMMPGTAQTAGGAVTQYLQFVDARSSRTTGVTHDYTADGLRHLAAAIDEVASADTVGGIALAPRIEEIRERADAMQRDPTSTQHALQTREAFTIVSSMIAQMRPAGTDRAVNNLDELQNAAMAIDPSQALTDQGNRIEDFFAQAADALRDMSNM